MVSDANPVEVGMPDVFHTKKEIETHYRCGHNAVARWITRPGFPGDVGPWNRHEIDCFLEISDSPYAPSRVPVTRSVTEAHMEAAANWSRVEFLCTLVELIEHYLGPIPAEDGEDGLPAILSKPKREDFCVGLFTSPSIVWWAGMSLSQGNTELLARLGLGEAQENCVRRIRESNAGEQRNETEGIDDE